MKQTSETVFMNGTNSNDIILFGDIVYMNGAEGGGGSSADWQDKPADWSDIRKDCPANSIALYAGHTADYSQYDNLGFTATCIGGYKVYVDGNVYGSYSSGSTCNITWSTSGITTGDDITTPSALKAHKIWIEPATEGDNITVFKMTDRAGLLWLHSNVSTEFDSLRNFVGTTSGSSLIRAVTAKNNILKSKDMAQAFGKCSELEYVPVLDFCNSNSPQPYLFYNPASYKFKKVIISNLKQTGDISNSESFTNNYGLEQIIIKNSSFCWYNNTFLMNLYSLKKLPEGLYNSTGSVNLLYASSLEPTNLDFRDRTAAEYIKVNGDATHTAYGIKSLRVSNQAPFDGTTPQINVSYTGMDRTALVQLFNDLPTVSDGQIINAVGCIGAADLSLGDVMIAVNKGWTVAGGPEPIGSLYAYSNGNNTIYTPDTTLSVSSDIYDEDYNIIGNPTAVENEGPKNCSVINCTDLGNGNYEAKSDGTSKILTNVGANFGSANSWRIVVDFDRTSVGYYPTIFCAENNNYTTGNVFLQIDRYNRSAAYINGTFYDFLGAYLISGNKYLLEFGFTGSKFYFKVDGNETWSINTTTNVDSSQNIMFLNSEDSVSHRGCRMNLKNTYIEIDNVKTEFWNYNTSITYDGIVYLRDSAKDKLVN